MPGVLVTILFPIVLIFSIGLIIPTGIFVPAMYTASIAVGAMFFFGVGLMELKESKAKKYLEQTKLSSGTILATHIITTIFFLLIVAT
ncbi:MAG: hypothetical protein DRP42_00865 [Tenericutes bacterium]|nr:MAG: hypothetical protein DRP42_00865 [Mycoplasmatota bacterium]